MRAKTTTASHPVLGEIEKLLITKLESPLEAGEFSKCLGISCPKKKGGKPCSRPNSAEDQKKAKARMASFRLYSETPHNEVFYELVEDFINFTHCLYHVASVIGKFRDWKEHMSKPTATTGDSTAAPSPDLVQAEQGLDASSLDEFCCQESATPQQMPRDMAYADEESISDDFSSLTMSPGQESQLSFASLSEAGTTLTTPDRTPAATPLTYKESPTFPYDDDLRPETPTPASRSQRTPTMDKDLQAEEEEDGEEEHEGLEIEEEEEDDEEQRAMEEVLRGYEQQPWDVRKSQIRRFGSQKSGKRQLLCAIEKRFGGKDLDTGRVYIWRHQHVEGMLKIGWTSKEDAARHNKGNCYATNTTPVWESGGAAFVGSYRVEQIVHKQLRQQQVENFPCGSAKCKTEHREWFKYGQEDAIALIEAWTKFVKLPAYENGYLSKPGRVIMNQLCNFQPDRLLDLMKETRAEEPEGFKPQVIRRAMTISEEAESDICVAVIDDQPWDQSQEDPIDSQQDETESATGVSSSEAGPGRTKWRFLDKAKDQAKAVIKKGAATYNRRTSNRQKPNDTVKHGRDDADVDTVLESVFTQYYAVELKQAEEDTTQSGPGSNSKAGLGTRVKDWCRNLQRLAHNDV